MCRDCDAARKMESDRPGSRDEWWAIHREYLAAAWKPADKQETAWNHPETTNSMMFSKNGAKG